MRDFRDDDLDPVTRRLVPADAPVYRALMLDAYADQPEAFTSTSSERSTLPMEWWGGRLAGSVSATEAVWGAFDGDHLVGAVGVRIHTQEKLSHKCTLFGLYVRPSQRGRGIGNELVRTAVSHAEPLPRLHVIQLTVTDGNSSARRLYERHGFTEFGVEPCAVRLAERFVSKVHMWRPLKGS